MISISARLGAPALALALAVAGPAVAQKTLQLTVGAPLPDRFAPVAAIKNYFVPTVSRRLAKAGNYKIKWREAYGGQLYKSNASITSLQDGIADLGQVFTAVEPSRLPLSQVSAYTPGVTNDNRLMARVINELMETFAPLKAEWDQRHRVVRLRGARLDSTVHQIRGARDRACQEPEDFRYRVDRVVAQGLGWRAGQ
jgi:TRAP-type C4-dicarboxylate transport system substrate-binding protein